MATGWLCRSFFLVLFLSALSLVQAEDFLTSSLSIYPDCAVPCILGGLQGGWCQPTDQTCMCSNDSFQSNVTDCVMQSCTIPEALQTQNASMTVCNAPVRDRSQNLVIINYVLVALPIFFVAARCFFKILATHAGMEIDDWLIVTNIAIIIPSGVFNARMLANGLGKDIWTLTPEQVTNAIKYFYIMASFYFSQVALVKLSLLCFYLRIFPSKNVQRLLWGTFALILAWGIAYTAIAIFQCWPIEYFWNAWDGMHHGRCMSVSAISWSNAGVNIFLDLWIMIVPMWQLKSLKLNWKKKVGVALMFGVGIFVTIVSMLRLQSLIAFAESRDATWEFYNVTKWSTIEISVGVMCTCMPTLRLILIKVVPNLAGTEQRSMRNQYYRYDSDDHVKTDRSCPTTGSGGGSGLMSAGGSGDDIEKQEGITYQKSFAVEYSKRAKPISIPLESIGQARG